MDAAPDAQPLDRAVAVTQELRLGVRGGTVQHDEPVRPAERDARRRRRRRLALERLGERDLRACLQDQTGRLEPQLVAVAGAVVRAGVLGELVRRSLVDGGRGSSTPSFVR